MDRRAGQREERERKRRGRDDVIRPWPCLQVVLCQLKGTLQRHRVVALDPVHHPGRESLDELLQSDPVDDPLNIPSTSTSSHR